MAASQPSQDAVYNTAGNAASKEPAEQASAKAQQQDDSGQVDQRVPTKQTSSIDEATPTSMARGIRGGGSGEDERDLTAQQKGESQEVDGEQVATYGEGQVADANQKQLGGGGGQPGLETDLDRKKAEQAPARNSIQAEQKKEVDVAGVLGQRGGPANPVDKEGYPNKGS